MTPEERAEDSKNYEFDFKLRETITPNAERKF